MSNRIARVGLYILTACLILGTRQSSPRSVAFADDAACTGKKDTACNVVNGFGGNRVSNALGATIAGGGMPDLANRVLADGGTVGGGVDNVAGSQATVAGGASNTAAGYRATVGGGSNNIAHTGFSTISGGINNLAEGIESTIGGGSNNWVSAREATIAGGAGNIASFTLATVGGGSYNTASSIQATIAGGSRNTAEGAFSTIGGGSDNRARTLDATVSGGSGNVAGADDTTIAGGLGNHATDKYSTIGGGYANRAGNENDNLLDAQYATVSGGAHNRASGLYATVPGGSGNAAGADYTFAAGRRATVDPKHNGAILFADSTDADWVSLAPNEFAVRASGGVRLVTAIDSSGNPLSGVRLAPGGGSWLVLSDRSAKMNFESVDRQKLLAQVANLPLSTWSYKTQDTTVRHIGPMAQDFAQFGLGEDDKYINLTDENGVALAAIQGLYQIVQQQAAEIRELRAQSGMQGASHSPGLASVALWASPLMSLLFGAIGVAVGTRLARRRS